TGLLCFSRLNASPKSIRTTGGHFTPVKDAFSDSLSKANLYFDAKAYLLALPLYQYVFENHTDKKKQGFYKYRLGICCLYKTDQHEKALDLLMQVAEENKKAADIEFYLGRAYMLNYKFDDAVVRFASYLIRKESSTALKADATQFIQNCNNGKNLVAHPIDVKITNMGESINSKASEYVPVISSDESVLIFTYRGEKSTGGIQPFDINDPDDQYTEDVFMSAKAGGEWMEPFTAGKNINSIDHDACIALSGDGQKLLVFKNSGNDNGDIYMSSLDGSNWSVPEHLRGEVNSNSWEGSCSISANEKTLYFSSERPGGYGGRDLYKATLQHDGSWRNIKNLGSQINTAFDDDAPFIHPDGTTLIFSSKGHNGMGGYDIFKSFRLDTAWTNPENMGYPVNTPGDDIYYVLSADGQRGYYSSEKAGGFGQQDIYIVGPGLPGWKPALVLVKGNVSTNNLPSGADIEVVLANNNENVGIYKANASTGKYLINLPAGADYKIIYRKFGYAEQTKTIVNSNADSYSEVNYDVPFYDKLILSFVEQSKNSMLPGTQKSWKTFSFTSLPDDTLLLFLLEGKGADSIQEVSILINDITHPSTRCKENYFCIRSNTAAAAPAITEKVSEKTPEAPFGKAGNYPEIVTAFGSINADGLEFKVQVGAYRSPQNFNYDRLRLLGKVSTKNYEDQITRFTMGSFKTLNDADKLLKQAIGKGCGDAFVTAFYNGKRFLLKDLGSLKK
ncbi:MAG: hypothetical protein EPN85_14020, partial [Bacteroidetes bacterium]